ncbi:MAG: preprotein translocase subunit YajC [Candidatus Edwardsbacteria bacterium]|nr:preprotein translocase subunit YajC [Candidatus Edwardsbacteria bacterium]
MFGIAFAMGQGGAPTQGGPAGGGLLSLLPMVLIFVIIYFLIIWPQQKQRKTHAEMLKALQKGDRVVAAGGIHGTVAGVDEARGIVVVKIDENVKIEVQRSAVTSKLEK